jgi:peptide-methionine (S)-S-oxide reductase
MLKRFHIGAAVIAVAALATSGSAAPTRPPKPGRARATFAGGCFWCMEGPFDKLPGVVSTTSGYIGGRVTDPTYEQVSSGSTGHTEAVEIVYDPAKVTYAQLLDVFWKNVDPTDGGGQFCDRGSQYRTGIFAHGEEQQRLAEQSRKDLEASGKLKKKIVTEVLPAADFYAAEDYHQDYYLRNPVRYKFYRFGPTKVHPRLRRSRLSATEAGVVGMPRRTSQVRRRGRSAAAGAQGQK